MTRVAVFDFDGTVIRGDSVAALLYQGVRHHLLSPLSLCRILCLAAGYRLGLCPAARAKAAAHDFLTRLSPAQREEFLLSFAKGLTDRAFPQAVAQMKEHRARGEVVLLCSASCECYMHYVRQLLPVDALLCTPSSADGAALSPNCKGEEKVRRVQAWLCAQGLSWDALSAGYGDSGADAFILKKCAQPVLVNPKRALKKQLPDALSLHWGA